MTARVLAVDLGATSVAAAVDVGPGSDGWPGRRGPGPEPADVPGPCGVVEPAAVFAPADGSALRVGAEARRRAAADPSRFEPAPRRRVDDDELLLGTRSVGVAEACGAVIADALARAGPLLRATRPRGLVLTHPPGWDGGRLEVLRRAGSGVADTLRLVPEPVAAAAHARWMRPGAARPRGPLAVLDLGATAATAAVLEVAPDLPHGTVLVAHRHRVGVGGDDADELLLEHLLGGLGDAEGERVREVAAGATLADRRHRRVLLDDVRAARERLSDAEQAAVALPGMLVAGWLTRAELEDVLRPALRGVVATLADALADAGTGPERLAGVWLVGGGARTPLLGALVHRELGVPATVAPEPRTVVAHGALVVAHDLDHPAAPPADPFAVLLAPPPPAARRAPPPGPPPAPRRGRAPEPGRHPPDRDEDDTGEVLDDSWDGGWGPDPPWPDHWETAPLEPVHGRGGGAPGRSEEAFGGVSDGEHRAGGALRVRPPPAGDDPPASPRRRVATAVAVLALLTAFVGLLVGLLRDDGPTPAAGELHEAWGQTFRVPEGWVEVGGDPAARRVVLRPADDPRGVALIAVQSAPLPADAVDDPERVRAQIAARFQSAQAAGDPVSDMRLQATVGGREVARYRQRVVPGVGLDWIVVRSGGDQVSIGCRRPDDGSGGSDDPVTAPCDAVVASLRSAGS